MNHKFEVPDPHFLDKTKLALGALAVVGISLVAPNAAHATDAAPASPSVTVPPSVETTATASPSPLVTVPPSVEAAATASPSPSPTVLAKPSTFPSPSAIAEASPSLSPSSTPLPQPSKIKVTIDDSGRYPTGPKPTDLGFIGLPGVPLEPGPAHSTHGQTHHTYGPQRLGKLNELPATGLPFDELAWFGATAAGTGVLVLAGLKRPK